MEGLWLFFFFLNIYIQYVIQEMSICYSINIYPAIEGMIVDECSFPMASQMQAQPVNGS